MEKLDKPLEYSWRKLWKSNKISDQFMAWVEFQSMKQHRKWEDEQAWFHLLTVIPDRLSNQVNQVKPLSEPFPSWQQVTSFCQDYFAEIPNIYLRRLKNASRR